MDEQEQDARDVREGSRRPMRREPRRPAGAGEGPPGVPIVKQAATTVGIVAFVLVLALVFQLAELPAPAIAVIAVLVVVVCVLVLVNPHTVRLQTGRGLVFTRLARRQPVRVMRVGGVVPVGDVPGLPELRAGLRLHQGVRCGVRGRGGRARGDRARRGARARAGWRRVLVAEARGVRPRRPARGRDRDRPRRHPGRASLVLPGHDRALCGAAAPGARGRRPRGAG